MTATAERIPYRRRWYDRTRLTLPVTVAEADALANVQWAEVLAAVDRADRVALRQIHKRWTDTWQAPAGCIACPTGLLRAIAVFVAETRARGCTGQCRDRADTLSALTSRLCTIVEAELGQQP